MTVASDVVVSNIVLARSSTVSGLVSGPNGPAGDVQVELLLWDEDDEEFYGEDSAYTEEDGTYSLTINRPGHYTLFFDTDDSAAPVASAWLSGANEPAGPTSPGVFEVTTTAADLVRDKTLTKAQSADGQLVDAATDAGVSGRVVTYVWDEEDPEDPFWSQHHETTSDDTGNFQVRVPSSSLVTFGFGARGYRPTFLGGESRLPDAPTPSNSLQCCR